MLRVVDFERFDAGPQLAGVVEWFWGVAWELPHGVVHEQQVLNHPAGNVSIGTVDDDGATLDPAEGRVYGVTSELSRRILTGTGWTVAARTSVGGLGGLIGGPARELADGKAPLPEGLAGVSPGVVDAVSARATNDQRVRLLREELERVVGQRDPALVAEGREVVAAASLIEHDRSMCRVEQLADAAGTSVRSLQRRFDTHVGASPAFVIRRWRIIEAAEAARDAAQRGAQWRGWAAVAAELGYADQAHLTRDFRRHLGVSPSAYVQRNTTA